jgi:AraC-like DNA-binding protein/mannose-6-phosphate isomerase-like protein (cupin superfamily)
MFVTDATRKSLKEALPHGTSDMPFSLHHITIPAGEKQVLYVHWHIEFEFLMVISGGALFAIEDETFELRENEAVFINSNQLHSARALDELPCEFSAVVFHSSLLFGDTHNISFHHYVKPFLTRSLNYPAHITLENDPDHSMLLLLQDIAEVYYKDVYEYDLYVRGKLLELWHLFYHRSTPVLAPTKEYKIDRLQPVLEYISLHYTDNITLEELASQVPLSQGQFCRSFKETLGLSPVAYLNKFRILKSCELLVTTSRKISEIAGLTGFSNVSYYNRAFLSVIGCTPSDYQKQISK